MASYSSSIITIGDLVRLSEKGQLILQPKFQRRRAWEENARSYLIDSIVRRIPIPKIYLRKVLNNTTHFPIYEVVDGQQRLDSILSFRNGSLSLLKKHNSYLGDSTFDGLPEPVQKAFLEYQISTEVIEDAPDEEIWALFERLNSYTLTLNRQEKLNAKYFGVFKQAAYQLAAEKSALDSWKQLRIFNNQQIARMKEVEMTSDVIVALIRGISEFSQIPKAYKDYDDNFPMEEFAKRGFRESLSFLTLHLSQPVKSTRFRRLSWFSSLLIAVADTKIGITNGSGPRPIQSNQIICDRIYEIDQLMSLDEPPQGLVDLFETLSRATSHVRERQIKHSHFVKMLTLNEGQWSSHCEGQRIDL